MLRSRPDCLHLVLNESKILFVTIWIYPFRDGGGGGGGGYGACTHKNMKVRLFACLKQVKMERKVILFGFKYCIARKQQGRGERFMEQLDKMREPTRDGKVMELRGYPPPRWHEFNRLVSRLVALCVAAVGDPPLYPPLYPHL